MTGRAVQTAALTDEADALRRLQSLFDGMPAAVALLRGPHHVFEFANEPFESLVGGRAVVGLAAEEALPELRGQGFVAMLDRVFATGERELFLDLTYQPIRGARGGVEGIVVHDVRRGRDDRFRQAVESMIDPVAIATILRDANGHAVDFLFEFVHPGTQRRDDGAWAAAMVGRPMSEVWPTIAESGLLAQYLEVAETGTPLVLDQYRYNEGDATQPEAVFDLRATRLDGDLLLVWRDVTRRVRKDRALDESRERLAREHAVVLVLQQAILPRDLPSVEGMDIGAEYVAASEDISIGGDWFDVFALPDGRVAISVGDVAGKGIAAAQVMTQVRTAGRVAALAGNDAAGVLSAQNALMWTAGLLPFATAVVAFFEPKSGWLSWSSAGHLPPVVVAGGTARIEDGPTTRPPLGVTEAPAYETASVQLAVGDRFLLYTDGLVERRGEALDEGLARLLSALPTAGGASDLCRTLVEELCVADADLADDVCVVALERTAWSAS
jgi:hypothetical protein